MLSKLREDEGMELLLFEDESYKHLSVTLYIYLFSWTPSSISKPSKIDATSGPRLTI